MKPARRQKKLEQIVEFSLWNTRFLTILPVFFGLLSVLILFLLGSWEIIEGVMEYIHLGPEKTKYASKVIGGIIGGIDLYLIGIVLLIFSFGIYELFISKIDVGRNPEQEIRILEIKSLDQLKDKILKVIVMVLVVSFFKQVIEMEINTSLDLLYLAISIFLIAGSSYLMQISGHHASPNHPLPNGSDHSAEK